MVKTDGFGIVIGIQAMACDETFWATNVSTIETSAGLLHSVDVSYGGGQVRFTGSQVLPILTDCGGLDLFLPTSIIFISDLNNGVIPKIPDQANRFIDIAIDV